MHAPILAPAAALILWSLLILGWIVVTRFPALARAGLVIKTATAGLRYQDVEANLPSRVNWKSHNYTNLME